MSRKTEQVKRGFDYKSMPIGVYKRTEEHKKKLSEVNKGKKLSDKTRKKISLTLKGIKFSEEWKKNISKARLERKNKLGYILSPKTRRKLSLALRGRKLSEETKRKISEVNIGNTNGFQKGKNNLNWKGGITPLNQKIRDSLEYHLWRRSIFMRDNRTCIWCGSKKDIEADHIKPFAIFPELRFAIDNGRTLCRDCHKKTNTYAKNFLK